MRDQTNESCGVKWTEQYLFPFGKKKRPPGATFELQVVVLSIQKAGEKEGQGVNKTEMHDDDPR